MFGLVFTLALSVMPTVPSGAPAMPSASVTCPGWPASCDGAWAVMPADAPADRGDSTTVRRDYATPAESTARRRREPAPRAASGRRRMQRAAAQPLVPRFAFPESEAPTGSLTPAPRGHAPARAISAGARRTSAAICRRPTSSRWRCSRSPVSFRPAARDLSDVSTRGHSGRALAPPDSPASRLTTARALPLRFDARVGRAAPPQAPGFHRAAFSIWKMELIMNKGTVLVLLLVVLGGGYGLGRLATRDKDSLRLRRLPPPCRRRKVRATAVDRLRVPLEAHEGSADAKVTIVEFSDFQCPFCSRVVPTIDQIMKDYPNDVRLVFRHNPLPFHQNAPLAAEAAVAAEAQGKFWEMHDKMFANQAALDRAGAREVRAASWARHGEVQGRARHAKRRRASTPTGRPATSSARAARRRSSSTAARSGRAAVRGLQESDRRGDRRRQQAAQQGASATTSTDAA